MKHIVILEMYSSDLGWRERWGMYACLPVTVDGEGHGNPEIQGSTVSAGPIAKDPINNVKHIQKPKKVIQVKRM